MPVELMYSTPEKSSTIDSVRPTCPYAASSPASASRSPSPVSSIPAVPASSCTRASSSAVAIRATSFQVEDELDRVPAARIRDTDLVNHVLDQKQPPAAGLLQARELEVDVRRLGL